jgi:hypothetical protein
VRLSHAVLKPVVSYADLDSMIVEYLDAYGRWQPLENATAVRVAPGMYEITLNELSPTWHVSMGLFDDAKMRVNGLETKRVVGTRRVRDKVVLLATARERTPPPSHRA